MTNTRNSIQNTLNKTTESVPKFINGEISSKLINLIQISLESFRVTHRNNLQWAEGNLYILENPLTNIFKNLSKRIHNFSLHKMPEIIDNYIQTINLLQETLTFTASDLWHPEILMNHDKKLQQELFPEIFLNQLIHMRHQNSKGGANINKKLEKIKR